MISVCMATHNGERFLREQIDSIICQLSQDDEIVISDDGSTDDTIKIIKSYDSPIIKLIHFNQPPNNSKGQLKGMSYASRNFENALKFAKGDIIVLSDQDDKWYPGKIDVIKKALNEYDIIKHNLSVIDADGKVLNEYYYTKSKQTNRNLFFLMRHLPFRGCCMAFKRWVLTKSMPFPKDCLQHDSWIGMIARINNAKFNYIEQPLIYHRLHGDNASEMKIANSLTIRLSYRFKLIWELITHK